MPADKPFSPACERNREPILAVLQRHIAGCQRVLEIGSGTGQHAVHFAAALPQLRWQTSDLPANHAGIQAWLDEAALPNLLPPLHVDADQPQWDCAALGGPFDAVYSANTLHIMGWDSVQNLFAQLPQVLAPQARLVVYGPFNYGGQYTSPSNADFDTWLQGRNPRSAIRDFEAVNALAAAAGLQLLEDGEMPANNRCLVWQYGA